MTIDEFKKYAIDLKRFNVAEVEELILMQPDELDQYQTELERDTGNLSNWDHFRAFITMKAKVKTYEDVALNHTNSIREEGE
ncbi:hypothetical protein [Brevibacillus porteri]|uniref:hypothetical protein n=1 Tax=Brevibacillus porteri TaxID=2126350 RepID=UPI00362DBE3E